MYYSAPLKASIYEMTLKHTVRCFPEKTFLPVYESSVQLGRDKSFQNCNWSFPQSFTGSWASAGSQEEWHFKKKPLNLEI